MPDQCRPVEVTVDGHPETVRVHGPQPPSPGERAALEDLVTAARQLMAEDHYGGVRQDLSLARMHACTALPDGPVRQRLRDAIRAAMTALDEATRLRLALAELVRLKDGPRDDAYRAGKDAAWQRARDLLGQAAS
jgi:hypothetical protein